MADQWVDFGEIKRPALLDQDQIPCLALAAFVMRVILIRSGYDLSV